MEESQSEEKKTLESRITEVKDGILGFVRGVKSLLSELSEELGGSNKK